MIRETPISVVILTKNEENLIQRCIESVNWADEIVVVDSGSSDNTCDLAKAAGATVYCERWHGWARQRIRGMELARNEWIFMIDADEIVTSKLRKSILNAMNSNPDPKDGYVVDRRDEYFGVLFPNMKRSKLRYTFVRLFNKNFSGYDPDCEIHETVNCIGNTIVLKGLLLHWRNFTLAEQLIRYIDNAKYEARMMESNHVRPSALRIFLMPILRFGWSYIRCGGFRLGVTGLVQALMVATAEFIRNATLWELHIEKDVGPPLDLVNPEREHMQQSAIKDSEQYYDESYYKWQQIRGNFGGTAELIKFEHFIDPNDNVLDFGCGGGFLLNNLSCKGKLGVEINDTARENCADLGIPAVKTVEEVEDGWADKIISNHALEHVVDPYSMLLKLKTKLKPGGKIIFVVPCERIDTAYKPGNIDQHLYTWSPVNLGNLFSVAGFDVIECKPFLHRWMPKFLISQKILGWNLFHKGSWVYGYCFRRLSQTRIIAELRVGNG